MARVILGNGGHAKALNHRRHPPLPMLGPDDPVPENCQIIIGVGDMKKRRQLYEQYRDRVEQRVQFMDGVLIGPDVDFGENVLINTGAQIDHDCKIGDHCVIAPGAILCGNVTLGEGCFIGAGAIIVENVNLEPATFVPAGTLVVGQNDQRRPERRISDRELAAALRPIHEYMEEFDGSPDNRLHPDVQPGGTPDGEGAS